MSTATDWPPRPADRIRHGWRCTRRGPIVETVRVDPNRRPRVVNLCVECDQTDLGEQIRAEREARPT